MHNMTNLYSFSWALIGALLSFALSTFIPLYLNKRRYKKRTDILGNWQSSYQGIDEENGTWVTEKLSIDIYLGKLRLVNFSNNHKYSYTGYGKLIHDAYIVGDWISEKSGANAKGSFMLTICGQGECMYGYWSGSDSVGTRRYARWVLSKNIDGLENAKKHLEEMRKSRLSPL